jgi:hypothetical protein
MCHGRGSLREARYSKKNLKGLPPVIITYLSDIYTYIDVEQNPRRMQGQLHDASDGGARRQRHCGGGVSRSSLSFIFICEGAVKTFNMPVS